MKNKKTSKSELLRTLQLERSKREKLLAKIEKTNARLERRKEKLLVLEAVIADIEGQVAGPARVAAPALKD